MDQLALHTRVVDYVLARRIQVKQNRSYEIVSAHINNVEVQCVQYVLFHLQYLFLSELIVTNLGFDVVYLQWDYVFHLRRKKYAAESYQMNVFVVDVPRRLQQVQIKQVHAQKKTTRLRIVTTEYLDHPIHHSHPRVLGKRVLAQEGRRKDKGIKL